MLKCIFIVSLPTNLASLCSSNLRKPSSWCLFEEWCPQRVSEPDSVYENAGVRFSAFDPLLFVFTNAYQFFLMMF